jgi:hypothetical protein
MAAEVLMSRGVPEERILFLNLIASPEGIKNFATKFPKLRVVTAFVDQVSAISVNSATPGDNQTNTNHRDWMRRSALTATLRHGTKLMRP